MTTGVIYEIQETVGKHYEIRISCATHVSNKIWAAPYNASSSFG